MTEIGRQFKAYARQELTQLLHALLREWTSHLAVSKKGTYVDFDVEVDAALNLELQLRYRLYFERIDNAEIEVLVDDANTLNVQPTAIAPFNERADLGERALPVSVIDEGALERLCHESSTVIRGEDGKFKPSHSVIAAREEVIDPRLSLINGLHWIRTLSRDRIPPQLRWTGTPADRLFEQCFTLVMRSTFLARTDWWGSTNPGVSVPDGTLRFPNLDVEFVFDCKAANQGYKPSHKDMLTFASYVQQISLCSDSGSRSRGLIIVSSEFQVAKRGGSFRRRLGQLQSRVPGSQMMWLRADDGSRFGMALERSNVSSEHRELIRWDQLLAHGDVRWRHLRMEFERIACAGGYRSLEGIE